MKIKKQSLIAAAIALSLTACNEDRVIQNKNIDQVEYVTVTAKNGAVLTGLVEENGKVESFKGIEYATSKRFDHSVVAELDGSIDATEFGAICPQLGETAEKQSEACLHLNIWRPEATQMSDKLPVYVFIHGGSFESGSGSDPLNQGDTIVAQGAEDGNPFIAVSINYRLGLLGSLWTDHAKGGNYGIGDQKAALQWVNENIADFGGNPDDVTVFGESAGAMSIGILQQETPEPEASVAGKYYQRAIMQSNPYGLAYKDYGSAKKMKENLRLYVEENPVFEEGQTLAELSLEQIKAVQAYAKSGTVLLEGLLTSKPATSGLLPFAPYIEFKKRRWPSKPIPGYHLTQQPSQTQFSVPTVIGFNSDESNIFTSMVDALFYYNVSTIDEETGERNPLFFDNVELDAVTDIKTPLLQTLDKLLNDPETSLEDWLKYEAMKVVVNKLPDEVIIRQDLYPLFTQIFFGVMSKTANEVLAFEDYQPSDDSRLSGASDNVAKVRKLANDMLFTCAARKVVHNQSEPTTLYHFDYAPSFNFWPMAGGLLDKLASLSCLEDDGSGKACHAAELPFVFNKAMDIEGQKVYTTMTDRVLMENMSREWFKKDFFANHVYHSDNVLMIDQQGNFVEQLNWDQEINKGIDTAKGTDTGICEALEKNGLLFEYMK